MNLESEMPKIKYEKPTVIDLGPVTPAFGGSCSPTGTGYITECVSPGASPIDACSGPGQGFTTQPTL